MQPHNSNINGNGLLKSGSAAELKQLIARIDAKTKADRERQREVAAEKKQQRKTEREQLKKQREQERDLERAKRQKDKARKSTLWNVVTLHPTQWSRHLDLVKMFWRGKKRVFTSGQLPCIHVAPYKLAGARF